MAVFTAVQPVADTFCFWLPLYYEAKLALAVYLWANGGGRDEGQLGLETRAQPGDIKAKDACVRQ